VLVLVCESDCLRARELRANRCAQFADANFAGKVAASCGHAQVCGHGVPLAEFVQHVINR
jgi:hypothetical protein